MRVIQIVPHLKFGGAEVLVSHLAKNLDKLGCDVTVVTFFDMDTELYLRMKNEGIHVVCMNKKRGFDLSLFFKLYNLFKAIKPDVIHTHLNSCIYSFPSSVMFKNTAKFHTVHNVASKEARSYVRIFNKLFYRRFDIKPVAISAKIKETIIQEYSLPENKIPVVLNGAGISDFLYKHTYAVNDVIKVLHIGRFADAKNHVGLIEAFKIVHQKYPNVRLSLIGEGELLDDIKKKVTDEKLNQYIEFLGVRHDINSQLLNADMFCLPSNYEGVPITIIEAMATGMPIVATNVGGVSDLIDNHVNGLLCDNNTEDIADALISLVESEDLRKKLGQAARNKSKSFSADYMAEKYLELYKKTLNVTE